MKHTAQLHVEADETSANEDSSDNLATHASAGRRPDYGKGQGGCPGNYLTGDGPDAVAGWMSGAQWAFELNVSPEEPIAKVLGTEAWKAVSKCCLKYAIPVECYGGEGMVFAEFDALPREVWRGIKPAVEVTRRQVAEFTDLVVGVNPHEIGRRLKAERAKRFRERDVINKALNPLRIAADTNYTLAAVENMCGPDVARKARHRIGQQNRMAWSALKPHNLRERTDLVTAAELVTVFGVTPEDVAAMTPATVDDHIDAQTRHQRARRHYERNGATEVVDVAARMVPPSQMPNQSPPRQLIGHLIYDSQLAELIGPPASGKTFVALGMALSLAAGRNFGMHRVPQRSKVLYVAAEAPESVYLRALGWCFRHKVDLTTLDDWFTVYPEPLQLGDPEHMRQVVQYASDHGTALVVFDTRAMVTLGLDENSSTDQGVAIEACKALNRAGSAVLVVHHTPKDGSVGGGGRGSGAWYAAVYTSMYLKEIDRRVHLHCDKNKDSAGGCKHPLTYDAVTLPPEWMPAAGSDEERSTLALVTVDPFTEDTGLGLHGLNKTQLSTLRVIARFSEAEGLTVTMLKGLSDSVKDADHEIGKRSTIHTSLKALRDRKYVKVVKDSPTTYRASDSGWDLLLEEGLVTQDFADAHRHTVSDLGSQPYREAVTNIRAALDALVADGTIIPGTTTMTAAKRLVQAFMSGRQQEFGPEAWEAAWAAWKEENA